MLCAARGLGEQAGTAESETFDGKTGRNIETRHHKPPSAQIASHDGSARDKECAIIPCSLGGSGCRVRADAIGVREPRVNALEAGLEPFEGSRELCLELAGTPKMR